MTPAQLDRAFDSDDPEERRWATLEIPRLELTAALCLLVRALGDQDWRVRKEAGQAAVALNAAPEVIRTLVSLLAPSENVGLRNAVVETLASFGAPAASAVIPAVAALDADGRKLAAEILGRARDAAAMPTLEGLLSDEDANVRIAAAEAIGDLGHLALDSAAGALMKALEAKDLHLRLAALDAFNRLGVVVPWDRLEELTRDPILRRAALAAPSRTGHAGAGQVLGAALCDEQRAVYSIALVGLAELVLGTDLSAERLRERIGPLPPVARDRLFATVQPEENDNKLRRAALVVAAALGESFAIDFAIDALVDDRTAIEAGVALRIFGSQALPRILSRVAHGDAPLRAAAIDLVKSLADSPNRQEVRLALRAAVSDPAPEAASAALVALGSLGGAEDIAPVSAVVSAGPEGTALAAQEALAALSVRHPGEARAMARRAAAGDGAPLATAIVIGALGGGVLGTLADDVAFLATALSSADPKTRRAAVAALAEVGSHLGVEAVEFALADEERDIQLAAVAALGRLRTPEGRAAGAARLLEVLKKSEDVDLMAAAVRALGDTGDADVLSAVLSLVREGSPVVAVAAIETLGRQNSKESLEGLIAAASHPHAEVVKAALFALERFHEPRVRATIAFALSHAAWDVRRLAADCLGRFGGEDAAELLRDRLSREQEPIVLEALDRALAEMESPLTMRRAATIAPPKSEP